MVSVVSEHETILNTLQTNLLTGSDDSDLTACFFFSLFGPHNRPILLQFLLGDIHSERKMTAAAN